MGIYGPAARFRWLSPFLVNGLGDQVSATHNSNCLGGEQSFRWLLPKVLTRQYGSHAETLS